MIWNLERSTSSRQERVFDDHTRTVNRVSWHNTDPHLVISASQDGTVKLWDIRTENGCQRTMFCGAGAVRDVSFSPVFPFKFAAGFDSGVIQLWDLRNASTAESTLVGQGRGDPILAIDWHPEKHNWISSASRDKIIKIWNTDDSRVVHRIQTMASIARIKWRPGHFSQIASSSTLFDNRVHLWDIYSSHVPVASFEGHTDVCTGFLWTLDSGKDGSNGLISCSKDSTVRFHDIFSARFPIKSLRTTAVSWSPSDLLLFANDPIDRSQLNIEPPKKTPTSSLTPPFRPQPHGEAVDQSGNFSPLSFGAKGVVSTAGSFTDPSFTFLAQRYVFRVSSEFPSYGEVCSHNLSLARLAKNQSAMDVWEFLCALFPSPNPRASAEFPRQDQDTLQDLQLALGSFGVADVDGPFPRSFIPVSLEKESSAASTRLHRDTILDLAQRCIEHGDLQTSVAVRLLFQDHLDFPAESCVWVHAYSELLRRLKLWVQASEVLHLSKENVLRSLPQNSTTVAVALRCKGCLKLLEFVPPQTPGGKNSARGNCEHCGTARPRAAECSVCRQEVSGAYVWCQGCGHGGHLHHLRQWFKNHSHCPAGCQHQCIPT